MQVFVRERIVKKSGKIGEQTKYLFYFYVPKQHKQRVKQACFEAGAGSVGNYSQCSFEFEGTGQFFSQEQSNPFLGKRLKISRVSEVKVEIMVEQSNLKRVLKKFLNSHPYEEPAYGFIQILTAMDLQKMGGR